MFFLNLPSEAPPVTLHSKTISKNVDFSLRGLPNWTFFHVIVGWLEEVVSGLIFLNGENANFIGFSLGF